MVVFKYLKIFTTAFQSEIVGFSDFLAALFTENAISGLVHFDSVKL